VRPPSGFALSYGAETSLAGLGCHVDRERRHLCETHLRR
jgi:hypothetical protein